MIVLGDIAIVPESVMLITDIPDEDGRWAFTSLLTDQPNRPLHQVLTIRAEAVRARLGDTRFVFFPDYEAPGMNLYVRADRIASAERIDATSPDEDELTWVHLRVPFGPLQVRDTLDRVTERIAAAGG